MIGGKHFVTELQSHLPFTVFATGFGLLMAGVLTYGAILATGGSAPSTAGSAIHEHDDHEHGHAHAFAPAQPLTRQAAATIFHVFHPLHMLLSTIATTAMFWRHDRGLLKAIVTGVIGSVGVCGLSDVGMPYLSGLLLGMEMEFHWCIIQHPMLVIPFVAVGVFTGLLAPSAVEHATQFSHAGHVFVSSVASIYYLVSFGLFDWVSQLGYVFVVVVVAVVVPCCLSDIVFPLLVVNREGLVACPDRDHLHRGAGSHAHEAGPPHGHAH